MFKKTNSLIFVGIMAILALSARQAAADIAGSAHDFSTDAWSGGRICIVCHTPHNADAAVTPLWNHDSTATTFTVYSSPSLDATAAQPSASSKACLSCHDGTVALDSFGGNTGSSFISGGENLGTDLSDDHPVSFTFDTALSTADGGLHDPATTTSGLGGTIAADMLLGGKMECASCHDVHNGSGLSNLLVKSNVASGLCLTCHSK